MAIWVGVKEWSCCNDDRGASSLVKVSDKVRAIKNWGFCIDRNAEKTPILKAKNDITSRKGSVIESYGGGNTKLHDLVYLIPY
jgi:hypothetical protein